MTNLLWLAFGLFLMTVPPAASHHGLLDGHGKHARRKAAR